MTEFFSALLIIVMAFCVVWFVASNIKQIVQKLKARKNGQAAPDQADRSDENLK